MVLKVAEGKAEAKARSKARAKSRAKAKAKARPKPRPRPTAVSAVPRKDLPLVMPLRTCPETPCMTAHYNH